MTAQFPINGRLAQQLDATEVTLTQGGRSVRAGVALVTLDGGNVETRMVYSVQMFRDGRYVQALPQIATEAEARAVYAATVAKLAGGR